MSSFSPSLTISIPSYNRNDSIKRSINILLSQLNEKVIINVFDNGSTVSVSHTLADIISKHLNVRVFRNTENLGVSANIIKCFENCETKWMWLLGDDDPPRIDAIALILKSIESNPDYCFLNFRSHLTEERHESFYTVGINEFISKADNFGNVLMISLGVYNLEALNKNLRLVHQFSYCLAPHLIYLLVGLGSTGKSIFLNKELINFSLHNTAPSEIWSWLSVSMCLPILYELPLDISQSTKKILGSHLNTHIKKPSIIFSILEQPKYYALPTYDKRYYLRQIFFRSMLYKFNLFGFFSFFWYDLKLIAKDYLVKRSTKTSIERDERV